MTRIVFTAMIAAPALVACYTLVNPLFTKHIAPAYHILNAALGG